MKPKILTVAYNNPSVEHDIYQVNTTYVDAIRRAGGVPVVGVVTGDIYEIKSLVSMCDGLLLPGGEDIDMLLFGEEPHRNVNTVIRDRDIFELELFREAREQQKPILGICKGLQIITMATGGRLYQDIDTELEGIGCHKQSDTIRTEYIHSVILDKGSKLYELYATDKIQVNSYHHQAVKSIGEGMKITAKSVDGVIEAIESQDGMVIGVQWHPEHLVRKYDIHGKVFEDLIKKAISSK